MRKALSRAFSLEDVARLARRRLPRSIYDFYAGGAEAEHTLAANIRAFEEIELLPRVMRGVHPDTGCKILGAPSSLPIVIAPMGAVGFGCRGGDVALAKAATAAGIPYVLSTTATASIEQVATEAGGDAWFQLYALRRREVSVRLVERAKAAGYRVLVLTADVPVGGKRERDLRNDFLLPFRFTLRNIAVFASRPAWALEMLARGIPPMPNLVDLVGEGSTPSQAAASVGHEFDPALNWRDLARFRKLWPGKLVIKGLLHPDDAVVAADEGCDGVIVSNHGGRQLDGAVATMHALPAICDKVARRIEVLLDGGVRRGGDVAKALALGATAVLVGRPALYGACVAGEAGVGHVLDILRDELERVMTLCGLSKLESLSELGLRSCKPAR